MDIKLKDFEGPLDLLLHLVSKYEVDIYDVPIVEVIEQYLAYIKTVKLLKLELAGDYMFMASQLMLIKSRKLLPQISEAIVTEEDLEQDLFEQLEEYAKYKTASQYFGKQHDKRAQLFSREKTEIVEQNVQLVPDKTLIDLFLAFSKIIVQQKDQMPTMTTLQGEDYRIEDMMQEIERMLEKESYLVFSDVFHQNTNKDAQITLFLALLELVKRQALLVEQKDNFGEIILMKEPV